MLWRVVASLIERGTNMEKISINTLKNQAETLSAFTGGKYSVESVGKRFSLFLDAGTSMSEQCSVELSKIELSFYMMGYQRGFVDGRE
jgi:hypothetical protein